MKSLAPVLMLLLSFFILCVGHGLHIVLLPARASLEGYSSTTMGILMAAYYAGFITGTFTGPRLIARVGHIHVFAASAAGACAAMLCFPLMMVPALWIFFRFIYGLCLVHFYTVMESWLNTLSDSSTRGRILSIYMILNFVAMSAGQMLFSSTQVGGFEMFSLSALFISLSLLPLLLSRTRHPVIVISPERLGLKRLFAISPLGVMGALIAGLIGGAFWGLSAPFILDIGYPQSHVAWFVAASMLGGLIAQWPLGLLSDRINRRWVILLTSLMLFASAILLVLIGTLPEPAKHVRLEWLLVCGALFGAGFHPFYSLCIAHANDFVAADQFVRASASLQMVQSSGAMAGSILAGMVMQQAGTITLYIYIAVLAGFFALYTLARLFENRLPAHIMPFRLWTRTGLVAPALDPRAETAERN